jgi:hypothetical protein
MNLFSDMLSVFFTGLFICLIVQSVSWNMAALMRQAIQAVRSALAVEFG